MGSPVGDSNPKRKGVKMMRKMFFGLAIVAFLAWTGGTALAGFFHTGEGLICSDCHVMHYSQTHGYQPDGGGFFTPLDPDGPFHYLLRAPINDLCLECHDGASFAPDVFEQGTGFSAGTVRQAGGLNEAGGDGIYPPAAGHTLNSIETAPGSDPPWSEDDGLNCANCHAVHGGGLAVDDPYRNLGGFGTVPGPFVQISWARGVQDETKAVFVQTDGADADKYSIAKVWFNENDTADSEYATFCKACHTNFHGLVGGDEIGGVPDTGGFEEFIRHPSAGVDIGALGGGHSSEEVYLDGDDPLVTKTNWVKVMGWVGPAKPEAGGLYTPTCSSCHKGHGNQNAFGLIQMKDTGTVTEEGTADGAYRDLCKQCHVQG
jgi:hypothetical protein